RSVSRRSATAFGRSISVASSSGDSTNGTTLFEAKMARQPMEAVGAVDAQNAPTAPWKTAQNAVSHSYHRHSHRESGTRVLPMFPVNFVTYLPGCTKRNVAFARLEATESSSIARGLSEQKVNCSLHCP